MVTETIFTKSIAFNPRAPINLEPKFYPLFRSKVLPHGNTKVRFSCTSVRMNKLLAQFSKAFPYVQWNAEFADIETYNN